MFNAVVAATDLAAEDDAAVAVASSLARRGGLPLELVTVVDPERDEWAVPGATQRRSSATVLTGSDVATAIVEHVEHRDGTLLVMTTSATNLVTMARHSVAGDVLARLRQPVLLLGPLVPDRPSLGDLTPVAGVDGSDWPTAGVLASWQATFGSGPPWLVDVVAPAGWPAGSIEPEAERVTVEAAQRRVAELGVESCATVLHDADPVEALMALAIPDPLFVMTSDRWPGGPSHWYSTTRRLVQRCDRPVLVVPADLPT